MTPWLSAVTPSGAPICSDGAGMKAVTLRISSLVAFYQTPAGGTTERKFAISRQSDLRSAFPVRQLMERRTPTFEDIHAVAVRLAARKMTAFQRRHADREGKRLSQGAH